MSGVLRYNVIRFQPLDTESGETIGQPIYLTLRTPWKFSAGLQPDVNEAICSYREFDKLNGVVDQTGRIEFWYNSPPDAQTAQGGGESPVMASPDVTLENWRIVDVAPERFGEINDPDSSVGIPVDSESGNVLRTVVYRLSFSDFREQFVWPRGGRLTLGLVNAGSVPQNIGVPERSMSQLIKDCLAAMGISTDVPDEVESIDAPREIRWLGNHAPTELAKLLEAAGVAFCPDRTGHAQLQTIVTQGGPNVINVNPQDAMVDVTIPAVDRRGKTVIFSSYPNQTAETMTLIGPRDDQFYFVLQDSQGEWARESQCDLLKNAGYDTLLAAWNDSFSEIDPQYMARVNAQAFACIQLDDGTGTPPQGTPKSDIVKLPPRSLMPILAQRIQDDGTLGDVTVTAIVAQLSGSTWADSESPIFVAATFKSDENVIILSRPLFRVSGSQSNPYGNAVAMSAGNFAVSFTVPHYTQNTDANADVFPWLPDFYHVGFRRKPADAGGTTIVQISDSDLQNALTAGASVQDVIYVSRPDLRLRIADGNFVNQQDINSKAMALADKYLADSTNPTRISRWRGFADVAADGLVSEVSWDQSAVLTTAVLNNWYRPGGALDLATLLKHERGDDSGGAGGAAGYPNQGGQQEPRVAMTETGANRPMVPMNPTPVSPTTAQAGSTGNPKVLSGAGAAVDATAWNRSSDLRAAEVTFVSRRFWDSTAGVEHIFTRVALYDSAGILASISGESDDALTFGPCA